MDAIERVEVAIRTDMVNRFTLRHGAFGYLNPRNFSKIPEETHAFFIKHLREEREKSTETFVKHFKAKYVEEPDLPFWMACVLMSFGNFVRIFNYFPDRRIMAREYSINAEVMQSWLRSLNYVRNICAHHGRLWNRVLAYSPKIPTDKRWAEPVRIMDSQNRIFSVLTILKYLLPYTAPQSKWSERLGKLLKAYPVIPKKLMGFPENWKECPMWKVSECHEPIFRAVRE
jgi:abortive infection bacteriophage resistance protein